MNSHFINFQLRQFPLCQFPLASSTLTKWELTKWELMKWEVDQVGIDEVGRYHCNIGVELTWTCENWPHDTTHLYKQSGVHLPNGLSCGVQLADKLCKHCRWWYMHMA